MPQLSPTNRVLIFDTTLRDGEQSPGASMTLEEKIEIADMLDAMHVDIIEAGFPIASNDDFKAVQEIGKRLKYARVCALSRAAAKDIDRAAEAFAGLDNARLHTFISTSPVHMKHKLKMEPEQVIEAIAFSVKRARNYTDDVEWSPEDGTRTEYEFLCRCIETALRAGATTINIPDTVGYAVPDEYGDLITKLQESVPGLDQAVISTHCHNDLGLAVANSLAGVRAGARQIECTINGIGERAGNAALEEVVMAIKTRQDRLPFTTGIITEAIAPLSNRVSAVTSFPVQYNKAIVGKNAFAHESGIHQDGMLKNTNTYEIMSPETIGLRKSVLVMGKHSGRHAFRQKLEELGYAPGENIFEDIFCRFKDLADKKKRVFDEDIISLLDDRLAQTTNRIELQRLKVIAGTDGPQIASISLMIDGAEKVAEANGDGPVDAIFNAICMLFKHEANLSLYKVHAVTEGTDAQAEVSVRLEEDGISVTGRGSDTDTMVASARAYISALNRLLSKRGKKDSALGNALAFSR